MIKRKQLLVALLIISLFLFAACENDSNGIKSEDVISVEDVIELTVGGQDSVDHANTKTLYELAERVEEGTNGRIKMNVYPSNQLGDYSTMYSEIMKGTIDLALISIPDSYDERLTFPVMPYLISNYDNAMEIFAGESVFIKEFDSMVKESNIKFLGFQLSGMMGIATNKEIKNPMEYATDKDVLVRIPPLDMWRAILNDAGFKTVTIPYAELFTALQTGTAEGVLGTSPRDTYSTIREVIDYYYLYNVAIDSQTILMNLDLFNSLKPEEQELITDICRELSQKSIERSKEVDYEYLGKLEEEGIEIVEFKPEELEVFSKKAREKTWPQFTSVFGEDMLNRIIKSTE